MRHNNFKFTVKFILPHGDYREALKKYVQTCCQNMSQQCCEPTDLLITYHRDDEYIGYIELLVRDYGVPQVGTGIVAQWIKEMYTHCVNFHIEAMIVHPKAGLAGGGAIIRWDYTNDCPIVQAIKE